MRLIATTYQCKKAAYMDCPHYIDTSSNNLILHNKFIVYTINRLHSEYRRKRIMSTWEIGFFPPFFLFYSAISIHCRRWPQHAFPITCRFWAYPSTLAQCGLEGVLYIIWYYMHMYCEGHPLNLSTLTLHQPQTSSPNWFSHRFFSHILATTVSPPIGHL